MQSISSESHVTVYYTILLHILRVQVEPSPFLRKREREEVNEAFISMV